MGIPLMGCNDPFKQRPLDEKISNHIGLEGCE